MKKKSAKTLHVIQNFKMTSTRRSSRGVANTKKKYNEIDSDDEEAKLAIFDDSGSDFEDDLRKKNAGNTNKVVQKEPSSSSEGSSGEDEDKIEAEEALFKSSSEDEISKAKSQIPEVKKSRFKSKQLSSKVELMEKSKSTENNENKDKFDALHSLKSLNRQREKLLEKQIPTKKKQEKNAVVKNAVEKAQCFVPKSSKILHKSLSLSESSSSEDESEPKNRQIPEVPKKLTALKSKQLSSKKKGPSKPVALSKSESTELKSESPDEPSEDEIDFASQLESLAQNFTLTKNEDDKPSQKKSPLKSSLVKAEPSTSKASAKSIAKMLAQGEGLSLSSSENDSDEEEPKGA